MYKAYVAWKDDFSRNMRTEIRNTIDKQVLQS